MYSKDLCYYNYQQQLNCVECVCNLIKEIFKNLSSKSGFL